MPFVSGYLRLRKRGRPDNSLPEGEGPVDPDYGVDVGGEHPDIDPPEPPPGIWPPLTPEQPWRPIDPGYGVGGRPPHVGGGPARPPVAPGRPDQGLPGEEGGEAGQLPTLPPGTIWPPLPPGVHGKYLALVLIAGTGAGMKYRYVVVDADARPSHPIAPGSPGHPDQSLPPAAGRPDQGLPPSAQPKR
jgi:hypothetical protein